MHTNTHLVMPAEWFPHEATWLSWPRNHDTWPKNLEQAQAEFVLLAQAIAADEPVRVMAGAGADFAVATRALQHIANLQIIPVQTNDAWARDYAPTFVIDKDNAELVAVDWFYNAWGGKYPPFEDDQKVAAAVAAHVGARHLPVDLCLEGGAIEVDEEGTLFCTRSCAFDPNRNPDLTHAEIERRIVEAIGAQRVIWLTGDALIGDDTDGHIDQLARCTPGGRILYAWTDDENDPQHAGLAQNLADLEAGLKAHGLARELIPLPLPSPVFVNDVQIPACYCNFYITNGSVIVPTFAAPQDDIAAQIIGAQFPGRKLLQSPSVNLTVGLGSFHCLTQQQPRIATAKEP